MHICDLLKHNHPSLSFEFFPARTPEAAAALYTTIADLERLKPSFVSVTYGAGGTTRELTHLLVERIKETTSIPPVPHLTCVGHSEEDIHAILLRYAAKGIGNVLALRGDPPRNQPDYDWASGAFAHASDLVKLIKRFNEEGHHPDPRGFGIGVAGFPEGHPDTPNRLIELDHLKAKVDAGADYICTQLFFDNGDFLDFRDRCDLAGIRVPILAGIMPVVSLASMHRMAELAGGTHFPAALIRALQEAGEDPVAVERAGIDFAANQCVDLINHGVNGLHLYTLNKSQATREICHRLGIAGC